MTSRESFLKNYRSIDPFDGTFYCSYRLYECVRYEIIVAVDLVYSRVKYKIKIFEQLH